MKKLMTLLSLFSASCVTAHERVDVSLVLAQPDQTMSWEWNNNEYKVRFQACAQDEKCARVQVEICACGQEQDIVSVPALEVAWNESEVLLVKKDDQMALEIVITPTRGEEANCITRSTEVTDAPAQPTECSECTAPACDACTTPA
ncbi:MAG: hypothetical protein WCE21_04980 [Candidatus Babeliales bacterium]